MNSILIGKVFGIGNAIMSVPMIKALRKTFPDARILLVLGFGEKTPSP